MRTGFMVFNSHAPRKAFSKPNRLALSNSLKTILVHVHCLAMLYTVMYSTFIEDRATVFHCLEIYDITSWANRNTYLIVKCLLSLIYL